MDISFRGCMWKEGWHVFGGKSEMWFGRRSLSGHKNHRRGSGDQWVNIGASRFVMIWGRRGAREGSFAGYMRRGFLKNWWGGKRLGGTLAAGGQSTAFWNFSCLEWCSMCVRWSHLLHAQIYVTRSRQILCGVKRVQKATEEYFSNLSGLHNTIGSYPRFVWKTGGQKRGV